MRLCFCLASSLQDSLTCRNDSIQRQERMTSHNWKPLFYDNLSTLRLEHSLINGFSFRYDSNSGGEREIQRTMLELLNQLDGFDSRGDVKVSRLCCFQLF